MIRLFHPLARVRRDDAVVFWLMVAFALSQLATIGWDLPGSHGWDNDGVAPRQLFAGIARNLTPGQASTYPLLHHAILGVLCLPIVLPAALGAEGWTLPALTRAMLAVPVMTAISVVARLVAVIMGCIAVLALWRIAARTLSARAARLAVLCAVTSLSVAYYGRVSNLDMPYLMWTALAVHALLDIGEHGRTRDYLTFAVLTAAAVATKDQAYASFVLVGPLYLVLVPALDPRAPVRGLAHWRRLAVAMIAGGLALGVLGGGLLNPSGFVARVGLLAGPSSQDWRMYSKDAAGVLANLRDLAATQSRYWWPWPLVALAWLGVIAAGRAPGGRSLLERRLWRYLPLAAALSSLICFTLVVARTGHRFVLPLGFWLAYYGGAAGDALLARAGLAGRRWPQLTRTLLACLFVWAAGHSLTVHVTQWSDARHDVRRALAQLRPGSVVETYGLVTYLPHFDTSPGAPYRVQRVGPEPVASRNPLPGMTELEAPYLSVAARAPDVLVIPEGFMQRFLAREHAASTVEQPVMLAARAAGDGEAFFRAVAADRLPGYRVQRIFAAVLPSWARALGMAPADVHGSMNARIWVLERTSTERVHR
jgi:Dolichyl-phosphate-mannose-protein mannosyltransferase